jgi:trk system potassium uptake protein TrkH
MSYLLNEQDMTILYGSIKSIIMTTFFIEMGGVLLLYIAFGRIFGVTLNSLSLAVFHAVSAFCNAGFSLFSESLSGYTSDILINITIAFLIILGGISFSVLSNVINVSMYRLGKNIRRRPHIRHLSLNSKVVLIVSIILIFSGTLIIYAFEHGNSLLEYGIGTQYLAAFFQSVTLRTAGFNSIDFTSLNRSSYLLMILFMFIGGASGSTAGGVKVNTVGLVSGYVKSIVKGSDDVILFNQSVPKEQINRAFFIIFLYVVLIFIATMILTITENFATVPILFEVVSAIGTVGLSTGVTPHLTTGGKIAIILLMFIGRVGPLTVVVSLQGRRKVLPVIYPKGTIAIG